MKQSHMPLKLRKISFEYHEAVLGTTSVELVLCPTGTCVLSNKRRYDRSAEVRSHFFERFQIETSNGNVATMASAAKKLEAADEAAERVEEPRTEPRTEERTHHSETEEEAKATKEDDSVDSSRFCIHCGENPCFVDTLFDAAESYCDRLGEERDRPLSMVWRAKALRRYFYEHVGMDELPFCIVDEINNRNVNLCNDCRSVPCCMNGQRKKIMDHYDMLHVQNMPPKLVRNNFYREMSRELNGVLGRGVRKQLPRCVTYWVRRFYPNNNDEAWVGFQET
jgi:hypothetical protein